MSADGRSNRKSVPSSNYGESMFYSYAPSLPLGLSQSNTRSPQAEESEVKSPDFVWEAQYQDKMPVLENSISQVPSAEKRQMEFEFIDDMKATFDFKSLHKRKRPTVKQITADNKSAARRDRKSLLKPDNKKRRPRNAFILYRTVLQAKAEFKGKTQTELSRLIAACWQNEPQETRAQFERAAELEKAFGYGATDVFNIRVGPGEVEWDSEGGDDQESRADTVPEQHDVFAGNQESQYSQPISYPMYMPPYSPTFDHQQPDPYHIQANFHGQMIGSPYTSSPVYAGAPCTQINLSPQQAMFPFNTFPLESTADSAPMSPQDYRSPSTYYQPSMDPTSGNMTPGESFALQMSPPEVSDIPADYSAFEGYQMDFNQNAPPHDSNATNVAYTNTEQHQGSYQTYDSGNPMMYSQEYNSASHQHAIQNGSAADRGMYVESHYPVNNQGTLDGWNGVDGQIYNENNDCFTGHNVATYQ